MKNILVTGGTGFIGSHTCLKLVESGHKVFILDSLINSYKKVIEDIKKIASSNLEGKILFFKTDLRNQESIEKVFKDIYKTQKKIDAVIHFAGLKSVSESVGDPLLYWDVNFSGTKNLLIVMNKFNCKTFIFSSSATVYGIPEKLPILENQKTKPFNTYGFTKVAVENLLKQLFESDNKNWKIISLRYFNPAGAHISGKLGEQSKKMSENLFPIINEVAAGFRKKLLIFGNDWSTKDGTCVRDYIHIDDLAEGHEAALNYLLKNKPQIKFINLGTGRGFSVLEIIKAYEEVCGTKLNSYFVARREGDVPELVANVDLAKKLLDWECKKTLLDICKDGWLFQKNMKKYLL